ncbi:MAG: hypothetical protein ACKO6Q_04915 [Bacteroidota bacterium]
MSHRQNIVRIKAVHQALEDLNKQVLFVGGATVSLYTDRPSGEVRPTDDVDILIELTNYSGYTELEEKLRRKGFVNDVYSGVICRYKIQGVVVDVMPTRGDVLGFTNRWYADGFIYPMEIDLGQNIVIKIFNPPYFLASKMEAFKNRGGGDGRMSSDFEDVVFILNNRNAIWGELENAPIRVVNFLKEEF